jgi:pimeloyl-ACP methyl ester carboxylesterase
MKKLLVSIIAICLFGQLNAQDITGSWVGVIPAGGSNLHIIFNIKKTTDDGYSATFDVPEQKAVGIPCSKVYKIKDSVFIEIAIIKGGYKGLWDKHNSLAGTYRQGSGQTGLNLTRVTDAEKANLTTDKVRPQTPKPPFNYYTEDVEYDNADKSIHYGATFTRPNGGGQYPTVIIISGSGTQDRNGAMMGHQFYWVLADYLTKNGIAVLRVDDRGAGKSTMGNNMANATTVDFSYDVEASLNYLESRMDIDKKHLGLIGHSEGGIIAPMVAARRKDVSFIVLWGASAIGGGKISTEQNGYGLRHSGIDSLSADAYMQLHQQLLDLYKSSANREILNQKITGVYNTWKTKQTPKTLTALLVNGNSILGKDVFTVYDGMYDVAWIRFFMSYDPSIDLHKVTCPVLAVNGTKDTQVIANENLPVIQSVLTKSGNKDVTVVSIPNLNHFLQTAVTGDISETEKIDETMSPVALNIICSWIKLHAK